VLVAHGLSPIFLLSPTTTAERVRKANGLGSGFLYAISRLGVTGVRDAVADDAKALVDRLREDATLPIALGFGLSRPEHIRDVGRYADAAVVGSALVAQIARHGQSPALADEVRSFVRWLREGASA
jgi:tryptophan synthase alpha chain